MIVAAPHCELGCTAMTVAILGTGLLGSGFARALRKKGESVRVWNRTLERARPLAADGIEIFDTAAAAVREASRVHVVVSDDAAVDSVLAAAGESLPTLVIDHSTTSTRGAVRRTSEWAVRGITYVHAPVFMGPQNAADSTGFMLVSGDPKTGPVAFIVEIPPGGTAGLHSHTSEYHAIVVGGAPAHWLPHEKNEGEAQAVGTYWFQPGGYVHGDRCTGATPCHAFLMMPKPLDVKPVTKN